MAQLKKYAGETVFGLDIGTRSIVGTVGYKKGNTFHVIAQRVKEHESRAMLDGQIHDIGKVGATILYVKHELEEATGEKLKKVCIAAAGRVLKTTTVHVEIEFSEARTVTIEDIYELKSKGIQKAYEEFPPVSETPQGDKTVFYCVGNTVVHYYMNHMPILNPESHKAENIGADIIGTFLPDDVIDGLYKAVASAGLEVANLTLEPIAAIQVAIPEKFRMLNLALVDVGAGTSDICITQDGSIIAYGMIPMAGDCLTEVIARECLVDFDMAEHIKRGISAADQVEYQDVMSLKHTITRDEVLKLTDQKVQELAEAAATRIKELNGDKPVSAVFVVGGGGKIPGYTERIAKLMGISQERVALRGEDVMNDIEFEEENVKKDSTLVTPIGICLSYFEQTNNFIFVTFNQERMKLYDNDKLAVVDAALQADFENEKLFPRRGRELTFTVNRKPRSVKGQLGEAAQIKINGADANITAPIHENDVISVVESTAGADALISIAELPEFKESISVQLQDKRVSVPKLARVNGIYQTGYYDVQEGDDIEILDYCTVGQLLEFIDVMLPEDANIQVNHKDADRDCRVYENYLVSWHIFEKSDAELANAEKMAAVEASARNGAEQETPVSGAAKTMADAPQRAGAAETMADAQQTKTGANAMVTVTVNNRSVLLTGKQEYVYVDVFEYIDFDISHPQGPSVVTRLNGRDAEYMEPLHEGDVLEIYWQKD